MLVINYGLRPARRLRLKDNFNIVYNACKNNCFALGFASNKLRAMPSKALCA